MTNEISTSRYPARSSAPPPPSLMSALCNAIREPHRTCRICTAPVGGYERCFSCHRRGSREGLADIVTPLVYAVAGEASAHHLSGYKNSPLRRERDSSAAFIYELLAAGLLHEPCLAAAVGIPISVRAVVPSLTSRPGSHPLIAVASALKPVDQQVLAAAFDPPCDRTIRLDKFLVTRPETVRGRHVMLIDDVWTTGANAQSAALTLRRAGAAAVSVMVVGRWLDPSHQLTGEFLTQRERPPYDPLHCPVDTQRCHALRNCLRDQ